MDKPKNQMITEKSISLLQKNQYAFLVDSRLKKTEMKKWIEEIFDVKVKGINSNRVIVKKKTRLKLNYTTKKRMIIRLQPNYFIPLFIN